MKHILFYASVVAFMLCPPGAEGQSTASVQQTGTDTYVQMQQRGGANAANITQQGSQLNAEVNIDGTGNGSGGLDGLIEQYGEDSRAEVSILGDNNSFSVSQRGAGGPANNRAEVSIAGSNNSAQISQLNNFGARYGNAAYIDQAGVYNSAAISQATAPYAGGSVPADYDSRNVAHITQNGTSNDASIDQYGEGNQARITQTGDSIYGSITQQGAGSAITLTQEDSYNSYVISQTGCLINTCDATQIYQGVGGTTATHN